MVFKDMRLEDLMRNMARWYDVKVEFYREEAKDIVFTGDVKKYEDLNEVLEIIERVTPMPKRRKKTGDSQAANEAEG